MTHKDRDGSVQVIPVRHPVQQKTMIEHTLPQPQGPTGKRGG